MLNTFLLQKPKELEEKPWTGAILILKNKSYIKSRLRAHTEAQEKQTLQGYQYPLGTKHHKYQMLQTKATFNRIQPCKHKQVHW